MSQMLLLSTDSHVNEPPATWERIPKEFRDRGPRIVKDPPGLKGIHVVCEGMEPEPVGKRFLAGKKREDYRNIVENFQWEDWRGPWDPAARLKDMELDGVQAEVLYPSTSRKLFVIKDAALQCACLRAYNDWLNDYCSEAPDKLIGLVALSVLDIDWSVRELERCSTLKFRGAFLPSSLAEGSYADPRFDRIWATAQDLNFPVSFHIGMPQGVDRAGSIVNKMGGSIEGARDRLREISELQANLVEMIFGGVFERFPRLQIVFAEYNLCWILPVLRKMDSMTKRMRAENPDGPTLRLLPTDYVKRQIHVTFQEDRIGVLGTELFGAENYMWASDYPHAGSAWPHCRDQVEGQFNGIAADIQRKLTWDNGAKLYGLM